MASTETAPSIVAGSALDNRLPSSRLLALPAELRVYIYDLAFTSEPDTELNLLNATGPSDALTQTCRQIYSEASEIFKVSRINYWSTSNFFIEVKGRIELEADEPPSTRQGYNERTALAKIIMNLRNDNLKHITKLLIQGVRKGQGAVFWDGVWQWQDYTFVVDAYRKRRYLDSFTLAEIDHEKKDARWEGMTADMLAKMVAEYHLNTTSPYWRDFEPMSSTWYLEKPSWIE